MPFLNLFLGFLRSFKLIRDPISVLMFSQVLKQLRVHHNQSSAYHAQSQGALERFHQTLKAILRAYCTELGKDWEEGLPWLMLAAREVTQESTGFSPNELVFAHTVRGPLAALSGDWIEAQPPKNLIDYVNGFRHRLYTAGLLAKVTCFPLVTYFRNMVFLFISMQMIHKFTFLLDPQILLGFLL